MKRVLLLLVLPLVLVGCNKKEINTLKEQNSKLEKENTELRVLTVDQQAQLADHAEQLNELKDQSDELETENANLNDQLKAAKGQVTKLEASLAANTAQKKADREDKQSRVEQLVKAFNEVGFGVGEKIPYFEEYPRVNYTMVLNDDATYPIKLYARTWRGGVEVHETLINPSTINTYFTGATGGWILRANMRQKKIYIWSTYKDRTDQFYRHVVFQTWNPVPFAPPNLSESEFRSTRDSEYTRKKEPCFKGLSFEQYNKLCADIKKRYLKELNEEKLRQIKSVKLTVENHQYKPLQQIFADLANAYK